MRGIVGCSNKKGGCVTCYSFLRSVDNQRPFPRGFPWQDFGWDSEILLEKLVYMWAQKVIDKFRIFVYISICVIVYTFRNGLKVWRTMIEEYLTIKEVAEKRGVTR